ncbi:MAG: ORF6N domain-containing protein [Rikenellaceae bacterium]|jgi:hypothetical protein|nr:ORF6N domain-containing protein [Rikenellaceae bacterium]
MDLQVIQSKIYEIRGRQVMLDFDLAQLYQVETRVLKQAVRRNIARFEGEDFMFEITPDEYNALRVKLRSQFVILETDGRGKFSKYPPFAFTETGVAMLSSVLRSETAILVNRSIMRAFVAMRNYITTTSTLTAELAELRATIEVLKRDGEETLEAVNDLSEDTRKHIDNLYQAIAALSVKPPLAGKPRQRIGFHRDDE